MLKVGSKRRRTTKEIIAEKEEAAIKEIAYQDQIARAQQIEKDASNNVAAANILNDLVAQGIAVQDKEGNIDIPSASKQKNKH